MPNLDELIDFGIAFDFDGVISDTYHIFRGHFFDVFGENIEKESDHISFDLGLSNFEGYEPWWWHEIPVAITRYQHICPPIHGSIQAINAIYMAFDMEYVQIITAREPSHAVMQVTKLWCHQNLPFPTEIEFVSKSSEKLEFIEKTGIEYFVDDRFKTAAALAPVLHYSYLLNSPWNHRHTPLPMNVVRVDNLWEMKNHLQETVFVA